MKNTFRKTRRIRQLLKWHSKPPTWANMAKRFLPICFGLAIILAFLAYLDSSMAGFNAGLLLGFLVVYLRLIRESIHNWPFLDTIINWNRAEELSRELSQSDP
jgi:hypothetical protein